MNRIMSIDSSSRPHNIQPTEMTYPTCYKYKAGSLYSCCIKLPYKCIQLQVIKFLVFFKLHGCLTHGATYITSSMA